MFGGEGGVKLCWVEVMVEVMGGRDGRVKLWWVEAMEE